MALLKLCMDPSFGGFVLFPQNQQDSNLHRQQQNTDPGPGHRPHPYILIGAIDHKVQVCVFRRFSVSVQGAGSIGVMIAGVVGQESHAVIGGSLDAGDGDAVPGGLCRGGYGVQSQIKVVVVENVLTGNGSVHIADAAVIGNGDLILAVLFVSVDILYTDSHPVKGLVGHKGLGQGVACGEPFRERIGVRFLTDEGIVPLDRRPDEITGVPEQACGGHQKKQDSKNNWHPFAGDSLGYCMTILCIIVELCYIINPVKCGMFPSLFQSCSGQRKQQEGEAQAVQLARFPQHMEKRTADEVQLQQEQRAGGRPFSEQEKGSADGGEQKQEAAHALHEQHHEVFFVLQQPGVQLAGAAVLI